MFDTLLDLDPHLVVAAFEHVGGGVSRQAEHWGVPRSTMTKALAKAGRVPTPRLTTTWTPDSLQLIAAWHRHRGVVEHVAQELGSNHHEIRKFHGLFDLGAVCPEATSSYWSGARTAAARTADPTAAARTPK